MPRVPRMAIFTKRTTPVSHLKTPGTQRERRELKYEVRTSNFTSRRSRRSRAFPLRSDLPLDLPPLLPKATAVAPQPGKRRQGRSLDRQTGGEHDGVACEGGDQRRQEVSDGLVVDS